LQLDPQSKEAWLIKARAETERGELDDALVSYLRLSQAAPDDLIAQVELGELHLKRGHPDRACPLFRSALIHPQATAQQKIEMEWLLGVAYAKSERWSEAIEVMDRLIATRNTTADDWCFLGWTRMHAGDLAGAQSALQHAELAEPDSLAVRRFARQLTTLSQTSSHSRQVSTVGNPD
jgi:predicted Zn-dependent protease